MKEGSISGIKYDVYHNRNKTEIIASTQEDHFIAKIVYKKLTKEETDDKIADLSAIINLVYNY